MRKLTLRKESLAELSTADLTAVVGGQETALLCGPQPTPMPTRNLGCTFTLGPAFCGS